MENFDNKKRSRSDLFLDKCASIAIGNSPFSEETQKALLTRVVGPVTVLDLIMALVTIVVWVLF